ncbi:hypothetical protein NDU88_006866 [Pleurodeles waltl]|uniref:Uncharacterized protein n=1 Tax=Pleurodeles waltl TaxID=8319 RepID=A0AAV7N0G6_PLEWA|nr:hypothetical protein NDU88_006866 [Pleurodeles waltl]
MPPTACRQIEIGVVYVGRSWTEAGWALLIAVMGPNRDEVPRCQIPRTTAVSSTCGCKMAALQEYTESGKVAPGQWKSEGWRQSTWGAQGCKIVALQRYTEAGNEKAPGQRKSTG